MRVPGAAGHGPASCDDIVAGSVNSVCLYWRCKPHGQAPRICLPPRQRRKYSVKQFLREFGFIRVATSADLQGRSKYLNPTVFDRFTCK